MDSGPGSKYTWQEDLPASGEGANAIWVAYEASPEGTSPSVTLVAQSEGGSEAWSVPANTDGVRYERLPGDAIGSDAALTVRAINASVTIESVRAHEDADGDGLSDRVERATIVPQIGSVDAFSTEVNDPDTDDDGVPDGKEVGVVGEDLSGEVDDGRLVIERVASDPTAKDSDGDGLSDRVEHRQRTVRLLDTHEDARAFMRAFGQGEYSAAFGHASRIAVTSDPLEPDTDGDGLEDGREARLGTDPDAIDSDGDGIGDGEEVRKELDPTLYDITGPEITVERIDTETQGSLTDTREVGGNLVARDPSGIDRTAVLHKQNVKDPIDHRSNGTKVDRRFYYTVDAAGFFVDSLTGFQTRVVATDVHGNKRRVVATEVNSGTVMTAKALNIEGTAGVDKVLGLLAGFTAGTGETLVGLKAAGTGTASLAASLYSQPLKTAARLEETVEAVTALDRYDEYVAAIAESYEGKMRTANPYENGTDHYEEFRTNYYAGLLTFEGVLTVATGSAGTALKQSERVSDVARAVRGTPLARGVRAASSAYDTVSAPSRFVKQKLAAGAVQGASFGVEAAKRVYARAPSVGSTMRVRYHLSRADVDVDALDAAQQRRLGELVSDADPGVARGIRRIDPDTRTDLLDLDDPDVRRTFVRAYGDRGVNDDVVDTALDNYKGLSGDDKTFARESIQRSGSNGLRLLGTEICNSPCDAVTTRVNNLPDQVNGLSDDDATKLQQMFEDVSDRADYEDDKATKLVEAFEQTADGVSEGPGRNPDEVVENLKTLSDNGIDGFLDAGGTPETVYKGVAGESDIATTLLERPDVDASDIEMNRNVPDVSGASNDGTEVDVDAGIEVTVNGRTVDSPSFESKHLSVGDKSDFFIESEVMTGDATDKPIVDQLETQLKSDDVDDELVVVFPDSYDSKLGELGLKQDIRAVLDDRLSSDYTLEFTTYTELS